jgi:hypothetical protein
MISATRRWLRRNRNGIAIGAGVIGAGYLAGQYVLGKINDARERMQLDRISKEKSVTPSLKLDASDIVPCPDRANRSNFFCCSS